MNDDEIRDVVRFVYAGWGTLRTLTKDEIHSRMAFYKAGLQDLDYEQTKAAVIRIAHVSKFLPTVAEIRESVGVVVNGYRKGGLEAWGEVHKALKTKGSHRTPGIDFSWEDSLTKIIVDDMGWATLCASTRPTQDRDRFIFEYDRLAKNMSQSIQASPGAVSLPAPREMNELTMQDLVQHMIGDGSESDS